MVVAEWVVVAAWAAVAPNNHNRDRWVMRSAAVHCGFLQVSVKVVVAEDSAVASETDLLAQQPSSVVAEDSAVAVNFHRECGEAASLNRCPDTAAPMATVAERGRLLVRFSADTVAGSE